MVLLVLEGISRLTNQTCQGSEGCLSAWAGSNGYPFVMGKSEDQERIERRAELLPEEQSAGSDDPEGQAAAILRDSDERVDDPQGTRRKSTQTRDAPPAEQDPGP